MIDIFVVMDGPPNKKIVFIRYKSMYFINKFNKYFISFYQMSKRGRSNNPRGGNKKIKVN